MGDRINRPTETTGLTTAQKAHRVSPWVALVGMIPTMIFAWQSRDTAGSAVIDAKQRAQDVSVQDYERTDRTWRYTRRVLDRQADDIESCFEQLDDVSEALEDLYAHVADHKPPTGRRPNRTTPRTSQPDAVGDRPNWERAHRYSRSNTSQSKLPERLEDLLRIVD